MSNAERFQVQKMDTETLIYSDSEGC